MDEFIYNSLSHYFAALCKMGYYKQEDINKLLVLIYLNHILKDDYRGYVSSEDYATIEKALNCLYGTSCLIPYPEYKKMGNLKLGDLTELAQRVKTLEDTEVIKVYYGDDDDDSSASTVIEPVEDAPEDAPEGQGGQNLNP